MTKHEFMSKLKKNLRQLPFDEVKEAVEYHEQYFEDAGSENEQEVLLALGSPSAVASQIIAAYAVKDETKASKNGLAIVWQVILGVFAAPIALPIALVVFVLALSLVIVLLSVVVSIGAAGAGLVLYGLMGVITSIVIIGRSFSTAMLFFGLGLGASGIGLAILVGAVNLSKKCFHALAKKVGKIVLRGKKK